tara:strand:- start:1489 stop:2013 length:525 start_codon:yes stop_codon:yes gene_type:complete
MTVQKGLLVKDWIKGDMISRDAILAAQNIWAERIIEIGMLWQSGSDYRSFTRRFIETHYAYGHEGVTVQFKPTKARIQPFRSSLAGALSYFVGGNSDFPEDKGFALMPWKKIHFDNHAFYCNENIATVMGRYFFVDATQSETTVEYTFGYIMGQDGALRIFLHHSSLPFSPCED